MAKNCLVCGKKLGALSRFVQISDGLVCLECYNKTGFGFTKSDFERLQSYTGSYIRDILNGVVENPAQRAVDLEAAIEAAIQESGTNASMHRGDIKEAASMMQDDEMVIAALSANVSLGGKIHSMSLKNKRAAIVVVTNQRVIVAATAGVRETKTIYLTDINAIDESQYGALIGYVLRIQTVATSLAIEGTRLTLVPFRSTLEEAVHNARKETEQKSNVVIQQTVSTADEILKFKGLLDAGIITEEEFNSKKAQLLGL